MKRFVCFFLLFLMCFSTGAAAFAEAADASAAPLTIPTPKAGDVIEFGHYEQDNNLENGKEPIEWFVLEVKDGKAWLMTKYCIEVVIFYPQRVPMYWGKSDLRAWMNGDFLQEAFSAEEQALIQTTIVENDNPHGMKGAGADTEDKVYLLSKSEVLRFFPEMADRVAYPTEYARAQGATLSSETGSCRWWTRTPGARKMDMCGMRVDGRISEYGMQDVDWPGNTMRPVLWVSVTEPAAQ